MSWVTSFLRWRRSRRESRRIALVAEVANVVVQQHWQPWQLPTCCCSHCKLPIFHTGNFCPWCGTCSLAPEKPVAARSSPASYEIPDRHTSGYSLPVAPRNPKRTQVLGPHMVAATTDTHKLPAVSPELRHIIEQRGRIDEIVDRMRRGK